MSLRWGKMSGIWLSRAIKLVYAITYAIKNPGLEFCAIKAGIQQLSSQEGGEKLISRNF